MKIGIYISPAHAVPPAEKQILAPWVLVNELANGLVAKGGHQVYLFASKESHTSAILKDFGIGPTSRRQDELSSWLYKETVIGEERLLYTKMMEEVAREHIDIIHIHQPLERLYPAIAQVPRTVPLVFTFHDPILSSRLEGLQRIASTGNCHFVSISNAQRDSFPLPFAGTVYNGVSLSDFPFKDHVPDHQYMVAGRVVPEKGFDDAIAAVHQVSGNLVIAGKVYQSILGANTYWKDKIEPHLMDGNIVMKQFLSLPELVAYYGSSKAFLFPIKWAEPFGLVMIEAMACGTPVIAYNRGSVSEVVKDGVNGFIVDPDNEECPGKGTWITKATGVAGLVEAIGRIDKIDRLACRKYIEDHFSVGKMVEDYENLYKHILGI